MADNHDTNVFGTVYSNMDDVPLQGANVLFIHNDGEEYGASTDADGEFNIDNIRAGEYRVKVSFIGFEDYRGNITISAGKVYTVDAVLSIEPILMAKLEIISEHDAPYQKLPGAATVLDMMTIKTVNPIGTQEMLEYVPGINGFSDDGIGNSRISIGMRGLNPRRSSRILILEDGVPIQPALYVYPNMYYNPPADRIDQIEVIKGSGTILYGPQTMGGVINYFTKRPRNEFGGSIKLTAGENGYSSLFGEVGGFGNEKLKHEFQFLLKQGDGFRQNNAFEQVNGTYKVNYLSSPSKSIYLKTNLNYENSNATYTGLTQWSFDNDHSFNPKEHDNFEVFRGAVDIIQTEKLSSSILRNTTAFFSYFDRRWWRENDIFISSNDFLDGVENPLIKSYYSTGDLVRVGNGKDNFGILRTFYVGGLERSHKINHQLFNRTSNLEAGWRVYWERFIDDRQTGFTSDSVYAPDAREGVYFRGSGDSLEILGTSQHYETMALSGYLSESIEFNDFNLRPGVRLELFEQERIDRLQGSLYQDKTILVILPGIAFSKNFGSKNIFGGIHRGFTPPSSGALKILNFGEDLDGTGLDLDAEKSWNKELGLRGVSTLLDYEISGFHNNIENLVAAGRGTAFKNLGKVTTMGIEARTSLLLSKTSRLLPNLNFSYALLSTKVNEGTIVSAVKSGNVQVSIEGKELPYSPNHTLTAGLEFLPLNGLLFRADVRYVSEVYTDFENIETQDKTGVTGPIPEYSLLNLSGFYQITDDIKLFMSAKNATDIKYIGSRLHSNPGQREANMSSGILPGAKRQINLGIDYTF